MIIFKEYLENDSLLYAFIGIISLFLGYLINKKFSNPITRLEDDLRDRYPIAHQFVLIYFPEAFLAIILIATAFYYI